MTLFLKIFLWFWLSTALVVAVVSFINWSTQPENLGRQWQIIVGDTININAQTAAQIYENEGQSGLEEYLSRLESSERIIEAGFFDINGRQIAGKKLAETTENLFDKAFTSDKTEFDVQPEDTFAAKKIELKNKVQFVFITHWKRPTFPASPDLRKRILQILGVILTAGLFCYGLARYLTLPISKLRRATQKFADGDLQTRVASEIGNRRDEVAKLAEDFDEMAERIESLVTAEKRLTQDISHELRSPLARLNVALELARAKANPETQSLFERIETESYRLNEMISRLLTLSKLETDSENFEKHEMNLTKLFEQIVVDADFEANANGKSVKISQKAESRVFGNENLLRSAIENVLRNAVRYTKENTSVEVSLEKENKNALISVRDFGAGVPEIELENLFRPFYRVQAARDRKSGGIGLGLAIAERAVHAHGGTIEAKNLENGLLVKISLPGLN
ncbi:MAG TPA: ATP-binding protein [Pyrinomonadaceae bacterium]|nr:ATP-binding protein [Pyrinomonadaceae bacterium]